MCKKWGEWLSYNQLPNRFMEWRKGETRGMMSWERVGMGLDLASLSSLAFSLRSPVRNRYEVPCRPWALSALSSRRGFSQYRFNVLIAHATIKILNNPRIISVPEFAMDASLRSCFNFLLFYVLFFIERECVWVSEWERERERAIRGWGNLLLSPQSCYPLSLLSL